MLRRRASSLPIALALALGLPPSAASPIDFLNGQVQIHGYFQEEYRMISDHFNPNNWYASQWASTLNVELDLDLAPNGWGPFSLVKSYVRGQVRYDCIYTKMCGLVRSNNLWGDRAARAPANFTNGRTSGFTGVLPDPDNPSVLVEPNGRLAPFTKIPPFDALLAIGGPAAEKSLEETLAPILNQRYAVKAFGGTLGPLVLPLGPWNTGPTILSNATFAYEPTKTSANPLRPLVPNGELFTNGAQGLYVPSAALRQIRPQFGSFDQNFTQNELAWNRGASQTTDELKEAYVDLEMLDGRLWFRLGKQEIVWGKTELFRNQDQINPLNLGFTTLGALEDTRVPLWMARAVYNFYNVGPLEDVRIELVANLADYVPNDLGRCGQPYTIFLVCGKSVGLVTHGAIGNVIAGEIRPSSPMSELNGFEPAGRIEFRWDRYSFAITDYYGYSAFLTPVNFNGYSRKVDPFTGIPLDSNGRPYGPTPSNLVSTPAISAQALNFNAGNRQFFDVFCSATVGIAGAVVPIPGLQNECGFTIFSSQAPVPGLGQPISTVFGAILAGSIQGQAFFGAVLNQVAPGVAAPKLARLNPAPGGPFGSSTFGLGNVLTPQQQALLGCGAFYGTDCDTQGIDLFNAEASVLFQSFPMFEHFANGMPGGPVATRVVNGQLHTLPGAGGPFLTWGRPYDAQVDGCLNKTLVGIAPAGTCAGATTNLLAFNPGNGQPLISFQNEMAALSYNLLQLLAAFSKVGAQASQCNIAEPVTCSLVRAFFAATGTQRPNAVAGGNGVFGRRDFLWLSGSEIALEYKKRNILGLAMDFAEDRTKTNWGVEFTWNNGEPYYDGSQVSGFSTHNTEQLTISVDRPTFINFLNANRTFLFNTQWFFRYINGYVGDRQMFVNGPFTTLGTFTIFTGYFQDRLIPVVTFVHDMKTTSGAALVSLSYRFTEVFSASLGVAAFYGSPQQLAVPLQQPVLQNNGGSFESATRYDGLTAIAERNEVSLTVRYTF